MAPQRIMIFGKPGSGKSTFSKKLSKSLSLPLHHLDTYFYASNWVERNKENFLADQQNLVNQESWIIDGNCTRSFEMRYARAELVIYLRYSRFVSFWRILKRRFYDNSKDRTDRPEGCPEQIRWSLLTYTYGFEKRVAPSIHYLQEKYPHTVLHSIKNDHELNSLFEQLNKLKTKKVFN